MSGWKLAILIIFAVAILFEIVARPTTSLLSSVPSPETLVIVLIPSPSVATSLLVLIEARARVDSEITVRVEIHAMLPLRAWFPLLVELALSMVQCLRTAILQVTEAWALVALANNKLFLPAIIEVGLLLRGLLVIVLLLLGLLHVGWVFAAMEELAPLTIRTIRALVASFVATPVLAVIPINTISGSAEFFARLNLLKINYLYNLTFESVKC